MRSDINLHYVYTNGARVHVPSASFNTRAISWAHLLTLRTVCLGYYSIGQCPV